MASKFASQQEKNEALLKQRRHQRLERRADKRELETYRKLYGRLPMFRIGQRVKFLWRKYESEENADEYRKTRVQGSGKIIDILKEGGNTTVVVDTGASHFDLPVDDKKGCYIQPLED